MFGLGKLVDDFIDDPISTTANVALQPVRNAAIVLDGLTEGELRDKAALRLGADVVGGMALSELIELMGGD